MKNQTTMTKNIHTEALSWAGPQIDYGAPTWIDEDGNKHPGFKSVSLSEASNTVNRIANDLGVRFDETSGKWVLA
jgi:hypothetical protein